MFAHLPSSLMFVHVPVQPIAMFVSRQQLIEAEPSLTLYRIDCLCRGRKRKGREPIPPQWIEGIHWRLIDCNEPRCGRVFNLPLIQNWMKTRHSPELHDRAIADYLASLQLGA